MQIKVHINMRMNLVYCKTDKHPQKANNKYKQAPICHFERSGKIIYVSRKRVI